VVFRPFRLRSSLYPYQHFGILVDDKEDLPEGGERVEHRDGTIGVYVKDPFGNYLEYIWYSQAIGVYVKDPFGNYLEYIWYSQDQSKVFLK
jgi:extradiol dioxygenase family protein